MRYERKVKLRSNLYFIVIIYMLRIIVHLEEIFVENLIRSMYKVDIMYSQKFFTHIASLNFHLFFSYTR